MATGVIYLDIDDEITSAAARIRSAEGRRVAVVLPYGSRVATSRINFRLLARDAMTHEKRLSVIAGDAATRALAASAGLPTFASVHEYEESQEAPAAPRGSGQEPVGLAASATVVTAPEPEPDAGVALEPALTDTSRTVPVRTPPVAASPQAPGSAGPTARAPRPGSSGPDRPRPERVERPARGRIGATPVLIGGAVLALAVVVGAVSAFLLLPSATVAITPRQETIGPVPFQVIASTTATEPDAEAGIVPAETVPIDVEAANTFPATGKRVEEAAAAGEVRFDNLDPTTSNTIAKGAVVSTGSGIRFTTDRSIRIAAAKLVGLQIVPSSARVKVTAVDAGPEGNVEANTITTVPRGEEPLFLKVNNPDPTAGGTRTEFIRVKQADVDAAVIALTDQLSAAFTDRLDDPDLSGDGATVFPDTATRGEPVFGQDLEALVGQEVETFDLSATLSGSVTAVDAAPVQLIAEARLASSVDDGYRLVDESSVITVDPAVVSGGTISFPVVVTARQVRELDPSAIEAEILGRPLAEARNVLESYGEVDLVVWPEWVGTIPTIDSRVEVTIDAPVTIERPAATEGAP
ncbi:MAG: baseplate J/gp47 family protein [Candidatus Limnocylindrales bacterium]